MNPFNTNTNNNNTANRGPPSDIPDAQLSYDIMLVVFFSEKKNRILLTVNIF